MRKHLVWVLALGVALGCVGFASAAPNNQTIEGSIKPKKLPKGERKPISLDVLVAATNPTAPNGIPYPTTNAKVDFDKDIKFQQKGYPVCDPTQFGSATRTDDVRKACPDAIIGGGSAKVAIPTGPLTPPITVDADVIAANVKGNKVLLHSFITLSGGQPLVGQLKKTSGKYGTTLDTPVPPLAGGTAVITSFGTIIDKVVYTSGGKKRAIVTSSCKNKKIDFRARFTDNQGQLAGGTDTYACKQKGGN